MINILSGIDSTAAALNAERIRMDVVSENIANVNTTRGLDGKPYQRQQVVFESVLARSTEFRRLRRRPADCPGRPHRKGPAPARHGLQSRPSRRQRPGHGRHAGHQHPRGNGGHDRRPRAPSRPISPWSKTPAPWPCKRCPSASLDDRRRQTWTLFPHLKPMSAASLPGCVHQSGAAMPPSARPIPSPELHKLNPPITLPPLDQSQPAYSFSKPARQFRQRSFPETGRGQ